MANPTKLPSGDVVEKTLTVNALGDAVDDGTGSVTKLSDKDGTLIDVQTPMATDGDSVYAKDIDVSNSVLGGFTGDVLSLVNDLHSEIVNTDGGENPKTLLIHFQRTVITPLIGIGSSLGGSFSNVKVIGVLSGNIETTLADYSTDNTALTTFFYQFPNAGLNALKFEFHTVNSISLTNLFIPKLRSVSAFVESAIKYASSYISAELENGGSTNMVVDGSETPADFVYTAPQTIKWYRSFVELTGGTQAFDSQDFGNISALTNGVQLIVEKDGVETIMETWKNNMNISKTMYDFTTPYKQGEYTGRWTLSSDIGSPITLFAGDKIICRINDNLTVGGSLQTFVFNIKAG